MVKLENYHLKAVKTNPILEINTVAPSTLIRKGQLERG